MVFYESPKRVHKMLADLVEVYGETREAVVARELTKKVEEVRRGSLAELVAELDGVTLKGEVVVLVARGEVSAFDEKDTDILLKEAMDAGSLKDAVAQVVAATGQPRRQVYQAALRLEKEGK